MLTQARKGKGRANALEAARESLRDWERAEPEEIADVQDHLEWLEAMSLALVRPPSFSARSGMLTMSQMEWQDAGATEAEVAAIADRAYLAHSESLVGDADDWPSWARPVFSDARGRALAAAVAAREAEAAEHRLRRLAELKAKQSARRHTGGDTQTGGTPSGGAQAGGAQEGGAQEGGARKGGTQAAAPPLPTGDSSPVAPPKKKRKHGPQEGEEVARKDPGEGRKAVEGGTFQDKTRMVSWSRRRFRSRADDRSV